MARRCFLAVPAAALIVQGCGEEPAVSVTDFGAPWTTEPEFEFGESLGDGAGFGLISAVRVLGDGDLILVAEGASQRATLWTPDGSLVREVGRPGEGPGEFAGRFRVQVLLPEAVRVRGTVSGEIRFNGFEEEDSHHVWYAVRRNGDPAGVRRILLPPGFTVMDATDAHVWGYRRDDLGVQYVVGRRLLPPAVADEAEPWTTAPGYRIDEPEGTSSGFGRFSRMRVGGNGTRIVVQDNKVVGASVTWRILVFSPEGRLSATLDAADVPDGFGAPLRVQAVAGGFWVRHGEGSLRYSHEDRGFRIAITSSARGHLQESRAGSPDIPGQLRIARPQHGPTCSPPFARPSD